MQRFELASSYTISRVIKGGWHLAGGHGKIGEKQALEDMEAFVKAGITTFDCADIYTGVEELIGRFLKSRKERFQSGDLPEVQIHTKYVPDFDLLHRLTRKDTTRIIDRSLLRLGVERLDLVQFAWWDYQKGDFLEVAGHLADLQKEGKIRLLGATNFDTHHIQKIIDAGIKIAANQVQYSLLDRRVEQDRPDLNAANSIPKLCYGAIAGGFLSNRYLGVAEPKDPLENRSLTKYRLIIEEFGSWDLFQSLLETLKQIADRYEVGIADVAGKYILQKKSVGAIIVGARNQDHLQNLKKLENFILDEDDFQQIQTVLDQAKGPTGPFYELERDKNGKHGAIMKYNLNTATS